MYFWHRFTHPSPCQAAVPFVTYRVALEVQISTSALRSVDYAYITEEIQQV